MLYYVQRILKQLGFAVFNLSGGYVSWKACVAESEDLQKYYMKKNMGTFDRAARIVLAIIMGALYFTNTVTGGLTEHINVQE